mgnify:CR=1 FL=1
MYQKLFLIFFLFIFITECSKKEVISKASSYFSLEGIDRKQQKGSFRKILVIPGLPYTEPHREESVLLLKKMGIDNIISFSSILENLIKISKHVIHRIYSFICHS